MYSNFRHGQESLAQWRRESRICHPDIFEIYVALALPPGEVSKTEMLAILASARDKNGFEKPLLKLLDDKRVVRFLERMEDCTESGIPVEHIQSVVRVLMDIGGSFPSDRVGIYGFSTQMRLLRILHQLAFRFQTREDRFKILRSAMAKANRSIYTLVHNVVILGQEYEK